MIFLLELGKVKLKCIINWLSAWAQVYLANINRKQVASQLQLMHCLPIQVGTCIIVMLNMVR